MRRLTSSSKPLVFWPRTGMLAGESCVAGRCTLTLFTLSENKIKSVASSLSIDGSYIYINYFTHNSDSELCVKMRKCAHGNILSVVPFFLS